MNYKRMLLATLSGAVLVVGAVGAHDFPGGEVRGQVQPIIGKK
jgi:hypothetical protein